MSERQVVTLDDIERRLTEEHRKAYYAWVRHLVTLCGGALTLLVSLQKNYIPANPTAVWILKLCWLSLGVCIASGVYVLHGEQQTPLEAAKALMRMRAEAGDTATIIKLSQGHGHPPHKSYKQAYLVVVWSFAAALVTLSVFAALNVP